MPERELVNSLSASAGPRRRRRGGSRGRRRRGAAPLVVVVELVVTVMSAGFTFRLTWVWLDPIFAGGRRSNARFGIVGGNLAIRSGGQPNRALGVVAPAVRVGVFVAAVMETGNLVFETRAVALRDNRRRNEHEQIALRALVRVILESVADHRDVAENRDFGAGLIHFILEANRRIARVASPLLMRTFESRERLSMIGLVT